MYSAGDVLGGSELDRECENRATDTPMAYAESVEHMALSELPAGDILVSIDQGQNFKVLKSLYLIDF